MSEFTDLLLSTMDPVNALLLVGLAGLIVSVKRDLKNEIKRNRRRVARLEDVSIPDGGEPEDE